MIEPTQQQMEATFQSLPDWMREAYHKNRGMHQALSRCFAAFYSKEKIMEFVARTFFDHSEDLADKLIKIHTDNPPRYFITSPPAEPKVL